MKHGNGAVLVTQYIVVAQKRAICTKCGSQYLGPDDVVKCRGCGMELKTVDLKCKVKYPTANWTVSVRQKKIEEECV